jgi:hypothetical protein
VAVEERRMCMDRIRETHVQAQAYVTVTDTSTQLFICLAVCNWRLSKSYKQFSFRLIENTIRIDCEMQFFNAVDETSY